MMVSCCYRHSAETVYTELTTFEAASDGTAMILDYLRESLSTSTNSFFIKPRAITDRIHSNSKVDRSSPRSSVSCSSANRLALWNQSTILGSFSVYPLEYEMLIHTLGAKAIDVSTNLHNKVTKGKSLVN
jgi:hypothetical protein